MFVFFFMKETKGLTEAEVSRLYRTDNDEIDEFYGNGDNNSSGVGKENYM